MVYSFQDKLAYSKGVRASTDATTIASMLHGCANVRQASVEEDKSGVDFFATLDKGAVVSIDVKTRERNCSRFWVGGQPELALETWSVRPNPKYPAKLGWTLSKETNVDYIMFSFHRDDCEQVFLYPFQLLRGAFIRNRFHWAAKYKVGIQNSGAWQSECVFVPEIVVFSAIRDQMVGRYGVDPEADLERWIEGL